MARWMASVSSVRPSPFPLTVTARGSVGAFSKADTDASATVLTSDGFASLPGAVELAWDEMPNARTALHTQESRLFHLDARILLPRQSKPGSIAVYNIHLQDVGTVLAGTIDDLRGAARGVRGSPGLEEVITLPRAVVSTSKVWQHAWDPGAR
jgi:hypothetical protein